MRYAVLSDIHANYTALKTVLLDAEARECGRVVCLGDLVGYGNKHSECVQMVRKEAAVCVRGNFDDYVSTQVDLSTFNPHAAEAVRQMRQALTAEQAAWLDCLPYVKEFDGFTIVHATLNHPEKWGYVFDKLAAADSFSQQTTQVCFFGHTHVPVAFAKGSTVSGGIYSKIKIESGKKYFINPGSVGQPRDNNSKASYAIYDSTEQTVELRRLDYDGPDKSDGGDSFAGKPKPGPRTPFSGNYSQQN
ncbi:MAG: metallophosphoesterase family protein [Limisphaerales bacterium]